MSVSQFPSVMRRPFAILCGMAFNALIADLHTRLEKAGYGDLRPAHGFVFQRVAGGGAHAAEIAVHLGITRQSTQQIVDELEGAGYLRREPDAADGRAKRIVLTTQGLACLNVVETAFRAIDEEWTRRLGKPGYLEVQAALATVAEAGDIRGPLRPVW